MEAAHAYLSDEDGGLGFAYSGWAQSALPHRRLADDVPWQLASDKVTLVVEPGRRPAPGGKLEYVGVPFGAHARLILLYLSDGSAEDQLARVELGGSLRKWLKQAWCVCRRHCSVSNRFQLRPPFRAQSRPLCQPDRARRDGVYGVGRLWISGLPERPSRVRRRQATYPQRTARACRCEVSFCS